MRCESTETRLVTSPTVNSRLAEQDRRRDLRWTRETRALRVLNLKLS